MTSVIRDGDLAREQRVAAEAFLAIAAGRSAVKEADRLKYVASAEGKRVWDTIQDHVVVVQALRFSGSELVRYWQEVGVPVDDDGDTLVAEEADLTWAVDVLATQVKPSATRPAPANLQVLSLPVRLGSDPPDKAIGHARLLVHPDSIDGAIISLERNVDTDHVVGITLVHLGVESA